VSTLKRGVDINTTTKTMNRLFQNASSYDRRQRETITTTSLKNRRREVIVSSKRRWGTKEVLAPSTQRVPHTLARFLASAFSTRPGLCVPNLVSARQASQCTSTEWPGIHSAGYATRTRSRCESSTRELPFSLPRDRCGVSDAATGAF
jgi:hypothetical protein